MIKATMKKTQREEYTNIMTRTTSYFQMQRGKEQWNLRNIGPHLNKVYKRG